MFRWSLHLCSALAVPWLELLDGAPIPPGRLEMALICGRCYCAMVLVWVRAARRSDPGAEDTRLAEIQSALKEAAEWIVRVEPKDHGDRKESLRFSFNLEKVYGFLEDLRAQVSRGSAGLCQKAGRHGRGTRAILGTPFFKNNKRGTGPRMPSPECQWHYYDPVVPPGGPLKIVTYIPSCVRLPPQPTTLSDTASRRDWRSR